VRHGLRRARFAGIAGTLLALVCGLGVLGCAGAPPGATDSASSAGPAGPVTTDQVMVTYPPAPPAIWTRNTQEIARDYRLGIVYSWTLSTLGEQCVVFQLVHGSARDLVRRLASDPRVGTAQLLETFHTESAGGPRYSHLQHSAKTLHLDQAHRLATGKGIRVAVVDTGVDIGHPDLRGRVITARSFVDRGERSFTTDIHGTAVAGLIAATAGNDEGIVGVAPGAEIYALKECWQEPPGAREAVCNSYTLAKAVDFAIAQGVQVLNFSLAGPQDPLLGRLIGHALSKGIVVVAADGGAPGRSFPASYQGVIGILGSDDTRAGPAVPVGHGVSTLAAPSVDILTTVPHGSYDFLSGSSFAAAQVSGVAALLLERNPKLTPSELTAVLHKTAHPLSPAAGPASGPRSGPVIGQVDACAAVASLAGAARCE
jgi:subtilisin family serine protease